MYHIEARKDIDYSTFKRCVKFLKERLPQIGVPPLLKFEGIQEEAPSAYMELVVNKYRNKKTKIQIKGNDAIRQYFGQKKISASSDTLPPNASKHVNNTGAIPSKISKSALMQ